MDVLFLISSLNCELTLKAELVSMSGYFTETKMFFLKADVW